MYLGAKRRYINTLPFLSFPASPNLKGHSSPHFSAYVYCGQMTRCINMPLGMEVGLGPRHNALDGEPARPKKGSQLSVKEAQQPPSFRPMPIVATVAHLSYCPFYYKNQFKVVPLASSLRTRSVSQNLLRYTSIERH